MKGRGSEAQGPRLPTKLITATSPSPEPDDIPAHLRRTSRLDCVCARGRVCQRTRLKVEISCPVVPRVSERFRNAAIWLSSLNVSDWQIYLKDKFLASGPDMCIQRVSPYLGWRSETEQSCIELLTTCSDASQRRCIAHLDTESYQASSRARKHLVLH